MSVNFKPELGALKSLRPFVFWAQTTLPTVFDDSLSYYEVLTKLTKMVNTLLENTDTTEANVEALATAYDELQTYVNDYFENLDVTTEIDNKLEEWRDAGIIDNMVDSYVAPIIHDYLYGADDEGGVQKTLEDMLADATESLNNALSTFSSDSRQALNDFERDSRDALTDFEDATDDALDAIPNTVDAWLNQNFTNPSSPPLDATLSLENAAAQSKATGERCDQLEDLILSNNDWINSVSEVESNQYVVVNNDGTNPRIANDASSDPLRPMSVANITGGRSYLISCVGNTVGPNTFSPAYAICNLSYDLQDEPVYTILDFYPRSWDPQVKTYEIIRSKSVYIPETIGLQTVNCLILMGNTDITVTPKCGVLSVKTDNTLTDPMLPANSKAVGDALANKLPWPVTEGQKDLGTNGKALLSNGDGSTRWGDVGNYDQEIEELQNDVSELSTTLNHVVDVTEASSPINVSDIQNVESLSAYSAFPRTASPVGIQIAPTAGYTTYWFVSTHNAQIYFDSTPTYTALTVAAGFSQKYVYPNNDIALICQSVGTRYRTTDNTLPKQNNPVSVSEGDAIAITISENTNVLLYGYNTELVYSPDEEFKEAILSGVQYQPPKKRYIKYNTHTGGTYSEYLSIYLPADNGYIRYELTHDINSSVKSDIWRINNAFACDDNFENERQITAAGEWELAIHLKNVTATGASGFSGGIFHGKEVCDSVNFYLDDEEVNIASLTELTEFIKFTFNQTSSLYHPDDFTQKIAEHVSEHIFETDLTIKQSLEWNVADEVTTNYMAMFPISKAYSNRFSTDASFIRVIPYTGTYTTVQLARKADILSTTEGIESEFYTPVYPDKGSDFFFINDNGSDRYNKCYYNVTPQTGGYSVAIGEKWNSVTKYRINAV